ncbi:MAG: glycosyl hydrolase family 5 [Deltaproteobacteria bacterium]
MRNFVAILPMLLVLWILSPLSLAFAQDLPGWEEWKAAYIRPPGRVVDPQNKDATVSEGQGFGMLFAVAAHDQETFDRLWTWTHNNLDVLGNGLLAWQWLPDKGVTERNNATDGDLLIAWALALAGERFSHPETYTTDAKRIADAILAHLVVKTQRGQILLPGLQGFDKKEGKIVNLSYWVFPAFSALDRIAPSPAWKALAESGKRLLEAARFGRWQLPPDWLLLSDPLKPAPGWPPRFGYNAIRIPLYLAWAGITDESLMAPFKGYWTTQPCPQFLPAWTDLETDAIASYGAEPGIRAIRDLILNKNIPPPETSISAQGYYSASLYLLSHMALRQIR